MALTRRLVVAMLIVVALASASGQSARAVTTIETFASNASVIGGRCDSAKVRVFGDWDQDVHNDVTVNVFGPRGGLVESVQFENNQSGRVVTYVRLCGRQDLPGTYTVKAFVRGYDENDQSTSTARSSTSFEFRKTPILSSKVIRSVDYRPQKRVYKYVVIGRLLRANHGWRSQPVQLQAYVDGAGWLVIDRQRSRRHGLFGWQFKPNRILWAYVYQGNRTTRWDSSPNFRTPRRVGARTTTDAWAGKVGELRQLIARR